MKLATFSENKDAPEIGIVIDQGVVPLSRIAPHLPRNMIDLIARWDEVKQQLEEFAAASSSALPLNSIRLHAPIPRPGKIFAIGLNYADHIAESGQETPSQQIWFTKAVTSINGPFDPVQIPKVSGFVDYEVELVAIIGKGGRHIARVDAPEAIFGYCVGNDVTERAWQHRSPQWSLGKSFDTHAPFGPCIVTADEVTDPHTLGIRCLVNGEERQSSNTSQLVFNIWDQIAHLSQAMTLEPGDVIFTGTPGGVGAAMQPIQFLKAGDVVRCEIDGLGAIENRFEPEA